MEILRKHSLPVFFSINISGILSDDLMLIIFYIAELPAFMVLFEYDLYQHFYQESNNSYKILRKNTWIRKKDRELSHDGFDEL